MAVSISINSDEQCLVCGPARDGTPAVEYCNIIHIVSNVSNVAKKSEGL